MEFRILGGLEVEDQGRPLRLGGRQERALLALLLLRANDVVPVDEIVDELWGAEPPPSATRSVHALISKLRRRLENGSCGEHNGRAPDNGVVLTRPHGYVLTVASDELDLHRFESLLDDGRRALIAGQPREAAAKLRQGLALWRGPPLAEFAYDSFALVEIHRLDELRLSALEERIEADLALGGERAVVGELEGLVAKNPLRERFREQLMLALYRSGRQAEALNEYQRARRTLVDELGIEPGPTLQHLEQAILQQDEALALPAQPGTVARDDRRPRRRSIAFAAAAAAAAIAALVVVIVLRSGGDAIAVLPNSVAVIDPATNDVIADVKLGTRPGGVAFGDGSLWVANVDDSTLSRIDPDTLEMRTIAMQGIVPSAISAGAKGVWIANGPRGTVARISPDANAVVTDIAAADCGGFDASVAAARGRVWFVCHTSLVRIDPTTNSAARSNYLGVDPRGIAVGLGAVWVSNSGENTVSRIDPKTRRVTDTSTVAGDPRGLAVGEGAVWVAAFADDQVSRIASRGGERITTESVHVGDGPVAVAIGAGGVWVANSRDGTVSRIDPRTRKVVATIRLGNSPRAIVVGAANVWVAVQASESGGLGREP